MRAHLDTKAARPEAGSMAEKHGFSRIVVADCIYTHSQLTEQEKVEFVRTFIDIEDLDSLDVNGMSSSPSVVPRRLG